MKCYSSGNRQLEQVAALLSSFVYFECGRLRDNGNADFNRCVTAQRCMCTRMIVILPEAHQCPVKVSSVPE